MHDVIAVSTATSHTLAVTSDNRLWAWGSPLSGKLGVGRINTTLTYPVLVMDNVVAVSTTHNRSMAITSDGVLWAWGAGFRAPGKLGDGEMRDRNRPVRIMENVIAVTASSNHSLAIADDGSVWGWGMNNYGQMGFGSTEGEIRRTVRGGAEPDDTAFLRPVKVLTPALN
jgi:alpha-tubulin suppressor-like RCC1 family protein